MESVAAKELADTMSKIAYGGGSAAVGMGIAIGMLWVRMRSVSVLWRKYDEHIKDYSENRLKDAKEYATQRQVERAVNRLEKKMDDIIDKIDKLPKRDDCE